MRRRLPEPAYTTITMRILAGAVAALATATMRDVQQHRIRMRMGMLLGLHAAMAVLG